MTPGSIFFKVASFGLTVSILCGCVSVPARDGLALVSVNDVVARVKCELVKVVLNKAEETTQWQDALCIFKRLGGQASFYDYRRRHGER